MVFKFIFFSFSILGPTIQGAYVDTFKMYKRYLSVYNLYLHIEVWKSREPLVRTITYNIIDTVKYCTITFIAFRVEIVWDTSAHFVGGLKPALAVAVVLGVAPVRREVLLFHRSLLVQETLAVRFAEPVYRLVRNDVAHAHRYLRRLVELAVNLVTAGNVREIFGRVYHNLQQQCTHWIYSPKSLYHSRRVKRLRRCFPPVPRHISCTPVNS